MSFGDEKTQQIEYNFNIDYYKFFIVFLLRFNSLMTDDKNYQLALKELELRFSELNYSIDKFSKDDAKIIKDKFLEAKSLIDAYKEIENNRYISRHFKPQKLNDLGFLIEKKMFDIYSHLLGVMDRMDMIFKKDKSKQLPDPIFNSY